jgi:hypothetical protein
VYCQANIFIFTKTYKKNNQNLQMKNYLVLNNNHSLISWSAWFTNWYMICKTRIYYSTFFVISNERDLLILENKHCRWLYSCVILCFHLNNHILQVMCTRNRKVQMMARYVSPYMQVMCTRNRKVKMMARYVSPYM